MKFTATIFVEGEADLKFISDFVECKFGYFLKPGIDIQEVKGKDSLQNFTPNFHESTGLNLTNLLIFDSDDLFDQRQEELLEKRDKLSINFELFLLPNNHDTGNLETILSSIANPVYQPILNCFETFQHCLSGIQNLQIKVPDDKAKIFVYASLLSSNELAKEKNRDYKNQSIWNLDSDYLNSLYQFLSPYFQEE